LTERALALLHDSRRETSPIEALVERALRRVRLLGPTDREGRLLQVAEELSQGLDEPTRRALWNHVRVYVGLACAGWAANRTLSQETRASAFVAAIGLAATASMNLRAVMGLDDRLRVLAGAGVDPGLREAATRVVAGWYKGEAEILRALGPVLDRLDGPEDLDEVEESADQSR
jgi:hypothetical protein